MTDTTTRKNINSIADAVINGAALGVVVIAGALLAGWWLVLP